MYRTKHYAIAFSHNVSLYTEQKIMRLIKKCKNMTFPPNLFSNVNLMSDNYIISSEKKCRSWFHVFLHLSCTINSLMAGLFYIIQFKSLHQTNKNRHLGFRGGHGNLEKRGFQLREIFRRAERGRNVLERSHFVSI